MSARDSIIDREALAYARGLLKAPVERDAAWPAFAAMGLLAVTALGLAFAMLTAPPPGAKSINVPAVEGRAKG